MNHLRLGEGINLSILGSKHYTLFKQFALIVTVFT